MKLKRLLKDIPIQIKGSKDIEITGVCVNSKVVAPGNLFIAKKGLNDDGALYVSEAVASGAVAILTDIFDPTLQGVVQLIHSEIGSIEGKIAAEYYQNPSENLFMVAITGTNGKTTVSFMIKHLLDALRGPAGLIGTIEYIIGKHRYQASRTTPDVCSNQKMLRDMLLQGCESAVMEVTSHALDQGRVDYIDFDVAVFTNLTLDHLDYHKTMGEYSKAKQKLFRDLKPALKKKHGIQKAAVVNADSLAMQEMLQECKSRVITYGIDNEADLRASDICLTASQTAFKVSYNNRSYECLCPLIGRHNVYNYLAAVGAGLAGGLPLEKMIETMKSAQQVPGRLEPVVNDLGLHIYVDFAHTDDALINVLKCLKELGSKRLITVFGCGGDRDRAKRPKMGKACDDLSDFSIITSDNPRSEEPIAICNEIATGFKDKQNYLIEVDRHRAIEIAINMALPEDIILIAGKGHEPYQIFSHTQVDFDDRKMAAMACKKRGEACSLRP